MTEVELEKPIRMYTAEGRVVIVTHTFEGTPPEPNGYYYHYEDKPASRHWISNGAINIRFSKEPPALKAVVGRREKAREAAMAAVALVPDIGIVSVFKTDKGFGVQFDNDEQMRFDIMEF